MENITRLPRNQGVPQLLGGQGHTPGVESCEDVEANRVGRATQDYVKPELGLPYAAGESGR